MNSYNTEALTHAGYIVALIIGVFTLFSNDRFIGLYHSREKSKRVAFYTTLLVIFGLIGYFSFRAVYWSWMGSETLIITMESANAHAVLADSYTWISAIQANIMQEYINSQPFLAVSLTLKGFSSLGLAVYFFFSSGIFLAVFTIWELLRKANKSTAIFRLNRWFSKIFNSKTN
jgi:hypothetical protein